MLLSLFIKDFRCMNRLCTDKKRMIKNIVASVFFLLLLYFVYCRLSYLFCGQYNYDDRITVAGLKEEYPNSIDVVCIGGSETHAFWDPMKAYADYGFTSYDLATNSIEAEALLAYVREAKRYLNPELYVIGIRSFQYYDEEGDEIRIRVSSDALDMGWNRLRLLCTYINNRGRFEADIPSLLFNIAKYHTNYSALSDPVAWSLSDNSTVCENKGCRIQSEWCYLDEPKDFKTDGKTVLSSSANRTFMELINYCKKEKLKVLFVVSPYYITRDDYEIYNYLSDIVKENGFDYLNLNDYYEEMSLDFTKDFFDTAHVNVLGAEKYTSFLAGYIKDNYLIQDHRGEDEYIEWNEGVQNYIEKKSKLVVDVNSLITNAQEGKLRAEQLSACDDFLTWCSLADWEGFSVISVGDNRLYDSISDDRIKSMMCKMAMSDGDSRENYWGIYKYRTTRTNHDGETQVTDLVGDPVHYTVWVTISIDSTCNGEKHYQVSFDTEKCDLVSDKGLNILVYDNNFRCVVDQISLDVNEYDGLIMTR